MRFLVSIFLVIAIGFSGFFAYNYIKEYDNNSNDNVVGIEQVLRQEIDRLNEIIDNFNKDNDYDYDYDMLVSEFFKLGSDMHDFVNTIVMRRDVFLNTLIEQFVNGEIDADHLRFVYADHVSNLYKIVTDNFPAYEKLISLSTNKVENINGFRNNYDLVAVNLTMAHSAFIENDIVSTIENPIYVVSAIDAVVKGLYDSLMILNF